MNKDNTKLFHELNFERFDNDAVRLAKKWGIGEFSYDDNENESFSCETFDIVKLYSFLLYKEIQKIKKIISDTKVLPDSRFDQVAEEIDSLNEKSRKIDQLEKEIEKLKGEFEEEKAKHKKKKTKNDSTHVVKKIKKEE